jgi:hypothetical protein
MRCQSYKEVVMSNKSKWRNENLTASMEIRGVIDGTYSPDYVKRVAWDITDPDDHRGLRAAAIAYDMGKVVTAITEQTGVTLQMCEVDSPLEVEAGTLKFTEERKIDISHTILGGGALESYFMERVQTN